MHSLKFGKRWQNCLFFVQKGGWQLPTLAPWAYNHQILVVKMEKANDNHRPLDPNPPHL